MEFYEVTVETTSEASELVADILTDEGSDGVGIYDGRDLQEIAGSEIVWDYLEENIAPSNGKVLVKGYFTVDNFDKTRKKIDKRLKFLSKNCPFDYGSLEISVGSVDDEDWVETWKENFKPIKTGKITVVPEWIEYEAQENENVVWIDPGMAFGTGEHESTKLCLLLLQSLDLKGKSVVDVGTGSGILAIAAARLGAKKIEAFDIDKNAVKSAKENCKLNCLQNKIRIEHANLLDRTNGSFDVILANITADVLIGMSAYLGEFLKKDGVVITSGIILKREEDVKEAFEQNGLRLLARASMGEWVAMKFGK